MINTLLYRILLAIPTMLGVAVIRFMLVQIVWRPVPLRRTP